MRRDVLAEEVDRLSGWHLLIVSLEGDEGRHALVAHESTVEADKAEPVGRP